MKNYLPYILAAVFLLLYLKQCNDNIDDRRRADNVEQFLRDSITYTTDKYGREIAAKTALNNNLKLLLDGERDHNGQLKELVKKYKRIAAAANVGQEIRIDTVEIGYEVPVPCDFFRNWEKKSKWYSLTGTSDQNGITIDNITIPNQMSIAIGSVRKSWANTEYLISAVNSNPNIKTTQLDGYAIEVPKKRLGLSLVAGYGFTTERLQPFVGIGLSYRLFDF